MKIFAQKKAQQEQSSTNLIRSNMVSPAGNHAHEIPHLQRAVGNQAALRLPGAAAQNVSSHPAAATHFAHDFSRIPLHAPAPITLQPKLTVNTPGDAYEQEADHVAEQVMRVSGPSIEGGCACGGGCSACQRGTKGNGHQSLQTKHVGSDDAGQVAAPPIVNEVLASPGQALDATTRAFFEARFGHDFSRVRVHTDTKAQESAQAVDANAYTAGRDIVFGGSHTPPESTEGRRLLAHELAHVVQQGFAPPRVGGRVGIGPNHHGPLAIQRQKGGLTKVAFDFRDVFNEVKRRNAELAELVTPQSIAGGAPQVVKGAAKDSEEHLWSVSINRVPIGSSKAESDGVTRQKVGKITRVTHKILITWVFPKFIDPEFTKQTKTEKEAYNLTITEPLFHELLHARLMMEASPDYAGKHTSVFQGYQDIITAANSSAVAPERKVVQDQILVMMLMNDTKPAKDQVPKIQDSLVEFLAHEKYDAQTEYAAFSKTVTNAKIAMAYAKVVGARVDKDVSHDSAAADRFWQQQVTKLEGFILKFYDKIDQALQQKQVPATQPSTATQPSPAPSPSPPPKKQSTEAQ